MIKRNKNLLVNKSGIAILLVMSTIAILSFLLADFTYQTQINKIKSSNIIDRFQAKLNAEAGMNFALAQLRIYQEALNLLETNKNAQSTIKQEDLNKIISLPMSIPFQSPVKNLVVRNAVNDFNKKILLNGEMIVSISAVSGFINVNSLALDINSVDNSDNDNNINSNTNTNTANKKANTIVKSELLTYFEEKLKSETEKSTEVEFQAKYGNPIAEKLINELQYYVTPIELIEKYQGDVDYQEIEALYSDAEVKAKHAPLTSISELHLLQGWNDSLIELLSDKLTVHQSNIIEINKLNEERMKLLFPKISKIQLEEFFKERDGNQELNIKPNPFKNKTDFVNLVVEKLKIVSKQDFEDIEKNYKSLGLSFGISSNYFKIESTGRFANAIFKISALAEIPLLEEIQKKPKDKERPKAKKLYLKPRIIEVQK